MLNKKNILDDIEKDLRKTKYTKTTKKNKDRTSNKQIINKLLNDDYDHIDDEHFGDYVK